MSTPGARRQWGERTDRADRVAAQQSRDGICRLTFSHLPSPEGGVPSTTARDTPHHRLSVLRDRVTKTVPSGGLALRHLPFPIAIHAAMHHSDSRGPTPCNADRPRRRTGRCEPHDCVALAAGGVALHRQHVGVGVWVAVHTRGDVYPVAGTERCHRNSVIGGTDPPHCSRSSPDWHRRGGGRSEPSHGWRCLLHEMGDTAGMPLVTPDASASDDRVLDSRYVRSDERHRQPVSIVATAPVRVSG